MVVSSCSAVICTPSDSTECIVECSFQGIHISRPVIVVIKGVMVTIDWINNLVSVDASQILWFPIQAGKANFSITRIA